jgi:hypothetical protein
MDSHYFRRLQLDMISIQIQILLIPALVLPIPVRVGLRDDQKIDFFEQRLHLPDSKVSDQPQDSLFG